MVTLGQIMSPEQIKAGTMHSTNKAFERYFQGQADQSKAVFQAAKNLQHTYNQKNNQKVVN